MQAERLTVTLANICAIALKELSTQLFNSKHNVVYTSGLRPYRSDTGSLI